ncbi:MAG: hypothetical protein KGQ49_00180 [Verrucomicrobia bacterium]|nr:hypothetical protein [Verrucomicrobiota bacterium]MDE3047428.1 hypothetical protein [Verrucomicrobiota bacterium]
MQSAIGLCERFVRHPLTWRFVGILGLEGVAAPFDCRAIGALANLQSRTVAHADQTDTSLEHSRLLVTDVGISAGFLVVDFICILAWHRLASIRGIEEDYDRYLKLLDSQPNGTMKDLRKIPPAYKNFFLGYCVVTIGLCGLAFSQAIARFVEAQYQVTASADTSSSMNTEETTGMPKFGNDFVIWTLMSYLALKHALSAFAGLLGQWGNKSSEMHGIGSRMFAAMAEQKGWFRQLVQSPVQLVRQLGQQIVQQPV